jgi:A/G-specific adenine glycosylase
VQGAQTQFPGKKPKKVIPIKHTWMLLPLWQQQVLIYKRPPSGIWGGLWGFYEADSEAQINTIVNRLGIVDFQLEMMEPFRHTFSHFHLEIQPVLISLAHAPAVTQIQELQQLWYDLGRPANIGLAAPTKKLFATMQTDL